MSKIYAQAPSGVAERVAHLVKVMFPDLQAAGVRIDLLSVADDDPEVEHALTVRGQPAYGCCKAVDVKGRTMGRGDAEITIDEAKYLTLPDATKDALLAHEINHIELVLNKKGRVKLDCQRRPKITMRKHDLEVGWFISIAEKFGSASIECHQATQIYLSHEQTFFAFVGEGRRSLEEGEGRPSEKVREIASDIMSASPAVRAAARNLVAGLRQSGTTMTIKSGGHETTIDKDGVRATMEKANIITKDGRTITPTQMVDEIQNEFKK